MPRSQTAMFFFSPIWTIFKLVRDINKTNILTKLYDDWAKIVTSRVFSSHVIQLTRTIFKLNSHIKVFTCFHNIHIEKKCPTHWHHCLSLIWTIFELIRVINKTNVLTNFHDDWANIVTSRVFTSHVIQLTGTIFELNSHIKETNVLTKFHENWAKNVTSRVFTCFHNIHIEKKCPAQWRPCFSPIWTNFELVRDINKTNVLTNFHDDWAKILTLDHVIPLTGTIFELNSHIKETNKNAPPTGGHVFSAIWTIFELVRDINKTNVLTLLMIGQKLKTAPPTGGHIGHEIFELNRDFIGTKLLTKFHEDRTINVASTVFTNKCGRTTDGRTDDRQRPVTKAHLSNQVS
ncbi:hypothetical protein DPMN_121809 [Dreissena polymorpha]|uniref:Uncharacterized protein n=1 Tax=Dreissena polymorpha TaxID=45954 RepID=A0A9D4GRC7_DREPO|nr:hypothetical protein DPMN_121809 [Dreissena polymorpha]